MAKNLLIVESPAKCKTIKKYLGSDYEVLASYGHIADLIKKNMGIDIDNNFTPTYEISSEKKKVVATLRKAAKNANKIRIATDEDREGEAIGRHVARALKLDIKKTARITFHEITKPALQEAIKNPRTLDLDLVNAQQARRILDRLVGFELSPVLWKKIKGGLSAGRVQSVAVRLIVEREREIQAFTAKKTFKIEAKLKKDKTTFSATTAKKIATQEKAMGLLKAIKDGKLTVEKVETKPMKKYPPAPFITSTLQQEASTKIGYSVSQTMRLAQKLYEAGHITYMRTDSVNLSKVAQKQAEKHIISTWGKEYSKPTIYKSKGSNAQEAHECIRPTNFTKEVAGANPQEKKIYQLIRRRALASQMAPATGEKTKATITISTHKTKLIAEGENITFPGFITLYQSDEEQNTNIVKNLLPALNKGDSLSYETITSIETIDRHPARYTEASLVKQLEKEGIGRPSTYAPTINTIQKRGYVILEDRPGTPTPIIVLKLESGEISKENIIKNIGAEKRRLYPTDIGLIVNDFLVKNFTNIMDYQFTAQVEKEFDIIAQGKLEWTEMLRNFYKPFHKQVITIDETAERSTGERVLGKDPKTGKPVLVRIGRYGPLVQIGSSEDKEKQFASIPSNKSIENISLEDALQCFALPRILGERKDKPVKASLGRFGPYVQRGNIFSSIKTPDDPYEISLERAIELIEARIERDRKRTIKDFTYKEKPGRIIIGRRKSHEIKRNKKTIRLPKGTDGTKLTNKQIISIMDTEIGTKKKTKKKTAKTPKKKKTQKKRI